jgi:hypothetical protein
MLLAAKFRSLRFGDFRVGFLAPGFLSVDAKLYPVGCVDVGAGLLALRVVIVATVLFTLGIFDGCS